MNISRAGKQERAFWRSSDSHQTIWERESKDYQRLMNMQRAFAAGWMAGVAWARRNQKGQP